MEAPRGTVLVLAILLLPLAGCIGDTTLGTDDSNDGSGAGDDGKSYDGSSTTNDPGSFTYSGGVGHKTETETYAWTNPAPQATVQWSGGAWNGAFTLTIEDTAGLQVYQQTISETEGRSSQEATGFGVPGQWTITFEFQDFSGGMNLRIVSG